jgi:hypothetical protein
MSSKKVDGKQFIFKLARQIGDNDPENKPNAVL